MAQRQHEDPTIDRIIQLVCPLSADEHDYLVDEIRLHWDMPEEQREPWAICKEPAEERRDILMDTKRRVLGLIDKLRTDQRQRLLDELKREWLRRAIGEAEKSVAEGRVHTLEEVEARLDSTRREILERKNKAGVV